MSKIFNMLAWWCVGLSLIMFGTGYAKQGTPIETPLWQAELGLWMFMLIGVLFAYTSTIRSKPWR